MTGSACMVASGPMSLPETPAQRVARQMAGLLDRNHVKTTRQVEQMMVDRGDAEPISYTTINRILKAEARTEPARDTLRRLAELFGESLDQAFPEPDDERAPVVLVGGRRIRLKALDGPPLTQREAELLIPGSTSASLKPTPPPKPTPSRRQR